MKILAIDTATKYLSIALYDENKVCEYNLEVGRLLSSLISSTIKRVIEVADWQLKDIDYFCVGLGPGSFTGIRIGMATVKGLAWAQGKRIVGISTLDILANNVATTTGKIIPVIDAKRNLIYCSIYKKKDGLLKRVAPYMLLSLDELCRKLTAGSLVFGDALGLYREAIRKASSAINILDNEYWYPKAHNLITLALEKIRRGQIQNPGMVRPIYLYPKECQIKT